MVLKKRLRLFSLHTPFHEITLTVLMIITLILVSLRLDGKLSISYSASLAPAFISVSVWILKGPWIYVETSPLGISILASFQTYHQDIFSLRDILVFLTKRFLLRGYKKLLKVLYAEAKEARVHFIDTFTSLVVYLSFL